MSLPPGCYNISIDGGQLSDLKNEAFAIQGVRGIPWKITYEHGSSGPATITCASESKGVLALTYNNPEPGTLIGVVPLKTPPSKSQLWILESDETEPNPMKQRIESVEHPGMSAGVMFGNPVGQERVGRGEGVISVRAGTVGNNQWWTFEPQMQ